MTEQAINRMKDLRLNGMVTALEQQLEQPATYDELPFLERLSLLLEGEHQLRETRKHTRLLRQASFKLQATVQELDYQRQRNLQRSQVAQLTQGDWLMRGQNLLITGPCGTGKTYLACALGRSACLLGHSVRYFRTSRLLMQLTQAKADGSYQKLLTQLAKTRLLIVDDWGLEALKPAQRNDLMEIMDDRAEYMSTLIISQLPVSEWHAAIGDNTIADAILDRLMHKSHRIELKGESMRKTQAKTTEREHLPKND